MHLKEKLNPKLTALLVIDIQVDFCSPKGLLGMRGRDLSLMEPMIDNLEKIIAVAQKKGILTLYTQQVYDRNKLNSLQKEQYDLDGKLITCDINTDGYKFYRIKPPKSSVYEKYNFNVFSNFELVKELQERGIKTLVIAGVDTIFCVETAIRNGFDLGYKIVVPKDLIAGNAKHTELNNRTLELVSKTYGVVSDFEEISGIWENY